MAQGTVKWFNEQKRYGLMSPDHGGGDVFVRYSDMEDVGSGPFKKVTFSPS